MFCQQLEPPRCSAEWTPEQLRRSAKCYRIVLVLSQDPVLVLEDWELPGLKAEVSCPSPFILLLLLYDTLVHLTSDILSIYSSTLHLCDLHF